MSRKEEQEGLALVEQFAALEEAMEESDDSKPVVEEVLALLADVKRGILSPSDYMKKLSELESKTVL